MNFASDKQAGFTRTDLVAIIAVVAVFGMLAPPLRGDAESESSTIICRANKRQLMRAAHLYTMDNGGLLPPNGPGEQNTPGRVWVSGYIDYTGADATNATLTTNPGTSLLANYLERSARPFKCPADKTMVARTPRVPRARSVSMNNAVGTDPMQPKSPTPGPWLDGSVGHTANRTWRTFAKLSDMTKPKPADLWVVLDEHPDSINDAMFGSIGPGPQSQKRWIDWPAAYHNGAAGFGMADGSALMKTWVAPVTRVLAFPGEGPRLPESMPDLLWLAERTTALIADQP